MTGVSDPGQQGTQVSFESVIGVWQERSAADAVTIAALRQRVAELEAELAEQRGAAQPKQID